MLKLDAGRLKTCALIILIILSLVLSGSLWFEDYHGFSVFFAKIGDITFSKIINMGKDDIQSKYDKLFIPSKILANNGEEGHWVLYPTEQYYDNVWQGVKTLLKDISTTSSGAKFDFVEESEWNSLLTKRSAIVNFGYPLSQDILSILFKIDSKKINETASNINEMAVTRLGDNVIFYVKRKKENQFVYQKFCFSNQNTIDDKFLEEIFQDSRLIKYASLKEAFANVKLNLTYEDRVFAPIFSFSDSGKKTVKLKETEFTPWISASKTGEVNKLVQEFFQGGDYAKFTKNDGTHIFIDEKNNTLKVYEDGLIESEYKNDGTLDTENNDFKKALKDALLETEKLGGINSLYLTDIQSEKGKIAFKFNYAINGIPVICYRKDGASQVDSAVEVTVGKDMIKCKRFVPEYKTLENESKLLSSDHDSIINAIFENIGSNESKIDIEDISLVYIANGENGVAKLPAWLVRYKVNDKRVWITVNATKDRS